MSAPPLHDADARRRAVTDFETNLVVLAGAGTGKTSLLVERFLNLLGSGHAEIDGIAAITFTEKAAAEMRQRVADGLEELRRRARLGEAADAGAATAAGRSWRWLADAGVPAAEIERRSLRALEGLDQAKVQTIHAFCSELLRAHPVEAGVDPAFQVDTGDQARARFEPLWEEFLAEELGPAAGRAGLWNELLARVGLAEIAALARELAGFRIPPELLEDLDGGPTGEELLGGEVRAVADGLRALTDRASGLSGADRGFLDEAADALAAWTDGGPAALRRRVEGRTAFLNKVARGAPTTRSLAGASLEELKAVFGDCRHVIRDLLEVDERAARLVVEAVAPFARRLREDLLRRGWVGFDALLALARDLLRDDRPVRRALKRRFRTVLVDEFQDTDPLQYEIVLFLAEQPDEQADDAWRARLAAGRLFVVGDPKQSIYRFRGADYAAFRAAVSRVLDCGGAQLDLVASFRSVAEVIGPVNALFGDGSTCWSASDYQPRYEPLRPTRGAAVPAPRVEVWSVDLPDDVHADERRAVEGRVLAREIERVHRREGVAFRDVAVLFRAFASVPAYLRPLRERGIPFVVDGGKDFLKRPEISQTLAVLRTLAQPSDPVALLAFLRSPAGGLDDAELAAWAADGGRWSWRVSPDTARHPRLAEVFGFLRELDHETRLLPADVVVGRALEATALLPLAAAAYEGPQRVANLRKLAAAAADLARDGRLSLEEVVDALQEGGLADLEADSPLADDAADAVTITSIHKMKGLERDLVFLPDLARQDARPRRSVVVERTRADDGRPALALRSRSLASAGWVRHEREKQRHEEAEEVRVLYVAATRARERLVLIAGPGRKPPGLGLRALGGWGYDTARPPADEDALLDGRVLHRSVSPADLRELRRPAPAERAPEAVAAWREALEAARESLGDVFVAPSAGDEDRDPVLREADGERPPRRAARDLARATGVVVHRALEAWDGAEGPALIELADRAARRQAAECGLDRTELAGACAEILRGFLGSELAERFRGVERLGREIPVLLRIGGAAGRAWRGSIDLVYRDGDGAVAVADYKTDRAADPRELGERYRAQLGVYADAVGRALGLDDAPRAELWLLREGRRVVVPL